MTDNQKPTQEEFLYAEILSSAKCIVYLTDMPFLSEHTLRRHLFFSLPRIGIDKLRMGFGECRCIVTKLCHSAFEQSRLGHVDKSFIDKKPTQGLPIRLIRSWGSFIKIHILKKEAV